MADRYLTDEEYRKELDERCVDGKDHVFVELRTFEHSSYGEYQEVEETIPSSCDCEVKYDSYGQQEWSNCRCFKGDTRIVRKQVMHRTKYTTYRCANCFALRERSERI
jgi:hypothetical protein